MCRPEPHSAGAQLNLPCPASGYISRCRRSEKALGGAAAPRIPAYVKTYLRPGADGWPKLAPVSEMPATGGSTRVKKTGRHRMIPASARRSGLLALLHAAFFPFGQKGPVGSAGSRLDHPAPDPAGSGQSLFVVPASGWHQGGQRASRRVRRAGQSRVSIRRSAAQARHRPLRRVGRDDRGGAASRLPQILDPPGSCSRPAASLAAPPAVSVRYSLPSTLCRPAASRPPRHRPIICFPNSSKACGSSRPITSVRAPIGIRSHDLPGWSHTGSPRPLSRTFIGVRFAPGTCGMIAQQRNRSCRVRGRGKAQFRRVGVDQHHHGWFGGFLKRGGRKIRGEDHNFFFSARQRGHGGLRPRSRRTG